MGVVATSDPHKKLGDAFELYKNENRPLPADRLIQEAIQAFSSTNDELGLAEAYRQYAFFLQSPTVGAWEPHYRRDGFLDKSSTFETRYQNALDYFQKAKDLYTKHAAYDGVSNVDLNMGTNEFLFMKDNDKACRLFDESLQDHRKYAEAHPGTATNLPAGYKTYDDYIARAKKEVGCKS